MSLTLDLTREQQERLAEVADRLGIPVSELAAAAIRDLIVQPEAEFADVAKRILEKNRELYERLA